MKRFPENCTSSSHDADRKRATSRRFNPERDAARFLGGKRAAYEGGVMRM